MKPMLMNTEMVKAILAGRKTVTRRLIKPQPPFDNDSIYLRYVKDGIGRFGQGTPGNSCALCDRKMPYQSGDVLYVRESWCKGSLNGGADQYFYKADDNDFHCQWRPSIHMPKEAARIFLRVTKVRAERLQEITDDDLAKDFDLCEYAIPTVGREHIARIVWARIVWDSTIKKSDLGKYGWDANPWVWVISFERISKEEALKNV